MKNILNTIKTMIFTGIIAILTSVPVMADANNPNILTHYIDSKGDCMTVFINGTHYINSNVQIYSLDYLDNSITVNKNGQLYKFYDDNVRSYYLNENINVTFNDKMEIVDCAVLSEPQVYNTYISQIEGNTATLLVNWNKYTFENEEGVDGWKTGDKCKVIIQDGRLLEVRPIPLAER